MEIEFHASFYVPFRSKTVPHDDPFPIPAKVNERINEIRYNLILLGYSTHRSSRMNEANARGISASLCSIGYL